MLDSFLIKHHKSTYHGIITALFVVIFLSCLSLNFSPILTHERDLQGQELITAPAPVSIQGTPALNKVWRTFPKYNTGIAGIGIMGLIGAVLSGYLTIMVYLQEQDAEEKRTEFLGTTEN